MNIILCTSGVYFFRLLQSSKYNLCISLKIFPRTMKHKLPIFNIIYYRKWRFKIIETFSLIKMSPEDKELFYIVKQWRRKKVVEKMNFNSTKFYLRQSVKHNVIFQAYRNTMKHVFKKNHKKYLFPSSSWQKESVLL